MKPSDYELKSFCGSNLKSCEAEIILSNIMKMLKGKEDKFLPFTWKEYKKFCSHNVTNYELEVIELLVDGGRYRKIRAGTTWIPGGMLIKKGKTYSITNYLLENLEKFKLSNTDPELVKKLRKKRGEAAVS